MAIGIGIGIGFQQNKYKGNSMYYNIENGLRLWRSAVAKLQTGQNIKPVINCFGTSIGTGQGATDFANKGYVGLVRSKLASILGNAGTGVIGFNYPLDDSLGDYQLSYTGTWSDLAASKYTNEEGASFSIKFNGTGIRLFAQTGNAPIRGQLSIVIDSGSPVVWDMSQGDFNSCGSFDITGLSDGDHTLIATTLNTDPTYLYGVLPIKGNAGILVNNHCIWGSTAVASIPNVLLDAWAKKYYLDIWTPTLSVIEIVANDVTNNSDLTEYRTQIQNLITVCKEYGDVLLIGNGLRAETGTYPLSNYTDILKGLASVNNCAYIDINKRWGNDFSIANTMYGFYDDTVHPSNTGHQDFANAILNVLLEASV